MADQQLTGVVHGSAGLRPRWTLPLHAHHFAAQTYYTPQALWRPSAPLIPATSMYTAAAVSPVVFTSAPAEKNKNKKSFAADLLLGGVSSSVSKTLAAPVERVKMLLQNQDAIIRAGRLSEPYRGIGDCFARTVRDEGFFSLWRGNTTNVIRYFPTQMLGDVVVGDVVVGRFGYKDIGAHAVEVLKLRTTREKVASSIVQHVVGPNAGLVEAAPGGHEVM